MSVNIKVFHVSRTPPYGQWPIDTHKNIIFSGGSSQIDGLEASKFTFEDSNLIRWVLVVRKCMKTTFSHLIRLESSKVWLLNYKPSIWLLPPQGILYLCVSKSPYTLKIDLEPWTWNTLVLIFCINISFKCLLENNENLNQLCQLKRKLVCFTNKCQILSWYSLR